MSQLRTLVWLKWKLLRNSLRSSKAVVNKLASVLGMLAALTFSLIVAVALGVTAYAFTRPGLLGEVLKRSAKGEISLPASTEFIFFSILGFLYLMWATVPLSIGGSKQINFITLTTKPRNWLILKLVIAAPNNRRNKQTSGNGNFCPK